MCPPNESLLLRLRSLVVPIMNRYRSFTSVADSKGAFITPSYQLVPLHPAYFLCKYQFHEYAGLTVILPACDPTRSRPPLDPNSKPVLHEFQTRKYCISSKEAPETTTSLPECCLPSTSTAPRAVSVDLALARTALIHDSKVHLASSATMKVCMKRLTTRETKSGSMLSIRILFASTAPT